MLYKRNSSKYYWCRFTAPNGKEVRRTTKTANKRQAEEFEVTLKSEYWRVEKLGDKPNHTWQQAVIRWLGETKHKATHQNDIVILQFADKVLGTLYLNQINRDVLEKLIALKLSTGVKNATVNRLMEVIRSILNAAEKKWEWIIKAPQVRMLPVAKIRIRWITKMEFQRLLSELPEHLQALAEFSINTGLRKTNVVELEWSQVDLQRKVAWIHSDQAKGGKPIGIALNSDAMRVITSQRGKHPVRVFTYKSNPVRWVNTKAWRKALKRSGIENFRWHDLRHTWASWHVQNGTQLSVLKELGGWADLKMVLRYAHLAPEHLAEHAENICTPRGIGRPESARFPAHLQTKEELDQGYVA